MTPDAVAGLLMLAVSALGWPLLVVLAAWYVLDAVRDHRRRTPMSPHRRALTELGLTAREEKP